MVRPYLYVGGVAPTYDPDALAALRVTHVVSLLAGTAPPSSASSSTSTSSSLSSSLSSSSLSPPFSALMGGGGATTLATTTSTAAAAVSTTTAAAGVAASLRRRFVHAPVELADDGDVPLAPAVTAVANAVAAARAAGGGVYVHCYRGVSRSAAAAVGYLMAAEGCTYEEALAAVRRGRCIADPNGGFVEQLQRGLGVVVRGVGEAKDERGEVGEAAASLDSGVGGEGGGG